MKKQYDIKLIKTCIQKCLFKYGWFAVSLCKDIDTDYSQLISYLNNMPLGNYEVSVVEYFNYIDIRIC